MFANRFPDLTWLKQQAESRSFRGRLPDGTAGPPQGWPTVILNVHARETYRDNIPGPLSLFSNWVGKSRVTTESKSVEVTQDYFVLTNAGQRYTLEIGKENSETFNIHFGELWTAEAMASLTQTHGWLADHHGLHEPCSLQFYNKLFRKSDEIKSCLRKLQKHGNGDALRRNELLLSLLSLLIAGQYKDALRMETLDAVKGSTKKEILRRLHLATDCIYSSLETPHSLDELARVSMLSKFHFLRAFKEAFNQTPHQFITELRVEKAKSLLANTALEVSEIGRSVGFDTASTFSRTFRNATGVYPTRFRALN